MLGVREPEIYGSQTLADIEAMCGEEAERLGLEIDFRQSNHEGELVSAIQSARGVHDAIIINAAAYTHTSVAILDALMTAETLVIEVHLSNPYKREPFRHRSFVAPAAKGMICGLGAQGYLLALAAVARLVNGENE